MRPLSAGWRRSSCQRQIPLGHLLWKHRSSRPVRCPILHEGPCLRNFLYSWQDRSGRRDRGGASDTFPKLLSALLHRSPVPLSLVHAGNGCLQCLPSVHSVSCRLHHVLRYLNTFPAGSRLCPYSCDGRPAHSGDGSIPSSQNVHLPHGERSEYRPAAP